MPQAALASIKWEAMVLLTVVFLSAFAVPPVKADPCAEACRSQHNACRMAAKLLFSPRCDAQLQGCISQCFTANRFNRDAREGREPRDFRDRRGPPDFRGPPEERGPPRDFREFRERGGGPRWLGGRGWWRR